MSDADVDTETDSIDMIQMHGGDRKQMLDQHGNRHPCVAWTRWGAISRKHLPQVESPL